MPTILESLMFEIGIDTKKLSGESKEAEAHLKGIEERSGKAIEAMEQRGKQSEALFKGMKEEAGGFLSIVAGAITTAKIAEFAKTNMLGAESLGYMAGNLGMATERLRAWQLAAEKNGGTAAGITGTLQQAAMAVAADKRGQPFPGAQEFFAQGGLKEDLQSVEAYMAALSRIVQRAYSVSPSMGMNVASQLGISPESLNLMKQGPGAIQALLKEQEKYAAVSQSWADTSHETLNNFRNIGDSLTKIGTIMLEAVNPELRKMAEYVEKASSAIAADKTGIDKTFHDMGEEAKASTMGYWFGRLAGAGSKLTKFGLGPLGAVYADLINPTSTVSQAQEDAAMAQWRMEHGSGDDKEAYLRQLERNYKLPAGLMSSIWQQESSKGKNKGPSSAGAIGDMGLMPDTWKAYKRPEDEEGEIWDFYKNSAASARFLSELYNKKFHGDLESTLRWYNGGWRGFNSNAASRYQDEVIDRVPGGNSTTSKTDIQVNGPITINTQATDAQGIKQDLAASVSQHSQMAGMADTGTH